MPNFQNVFNFSMNFIIDKIMLIMNVLLLQEDESDGAGTADNLSITVDSDRAYDKLV